MWGKCDMLYTFRFERLDRFYKIVGANKKYYDKRLSDERLNELRACINAFFTY